MAKTTDYAELQRKYPRKSFRKPIAFLCHGASQLAAGYEIGEGGLSFESEQKISLDQKIVVNFFIPGGHFFSLKATLRSEGQLPENKKIYGISFDDVSLALKREIRAYVSLASNKNEKSQSN
jgi:c-di-GMP-binding flagellar brake protein YcgR